jgi:monomeric isocitrate dehydrogenase
MSTFITSLFYLLFKHLQTAGINKTEDISLAGLANFPEFLTEEQSKGLVNRTRN